MIFAGGAAGAKIAKIIKNTNRLNKILAKTGRKVEPPVARPADPVDPATVKDFTVNERPGEPSDLEIGSANAPKNELVPYDGEFATKQLLGTSQTPGGKQINFHAADRMVNPPRGRTPMSVNEVEDFIDTADGIKKIKIDDRGTSVSLTNSKYPKAEVVVDGQSPLDKTRIITVINPKKKK
jgi:hypothetical protein